MSADILLAIRAAGVELAIGESGNLKVAGDRVEIDRWLPEIRAHKPELLALLAPAADHPGTQVEPEPGPELHPDDMALARALPRHWCETDETICNEYLVGLASDPARRRQMYAEMVRLGLATYAPAPEQPIEDAAPVAVCARCGHWTPSPVNATGGLGRCLTGAAASRKPGACWPWPDAYVRCDEFDPLSDLTPAMESAA